MMPEQRSKNFEKVKRYYDNGLWKNMKKDS